MQYLENYTEFEDGADNLQRDYFAVMSWLYFAPFMPRVKKAQADRGPGDFSCKPVAMIYGESNCGKTNVVQLLLASMFGPAKELGDQDFTPNQVKERQVVSGLYPLFYDDVQGSRFAGTSGSGITIAKKYDWLYKSLAEWPCIITSLNSETSELPNEIRKRCLLIFADSPLPLDDAEKADRLKRTGQRIHNRMGTAFYREYLYRMEQRLKQREGTLADYDYLAESSSLLEELFSESLRGDESLPSWCRAISSADFQEAYWDRKGDVIRNALDEALYVENYPPLHGFWTKRRGNYVIGVPAMQRTRMMKEFPSHIVNRQGTVGDMLFLRSERTDKYMRRREPNWKSPVPSQGKGGIVDRALGWLKREKA